MKYINYIITNILKGLLLVLIWLLMVVAICLAFSIIGLWVITIFGLMAFVLPDIHVVFKVAVVIINLFVVFFIGGNYEI